MIEGEPLFGLRGDRGAGAVLTAAALIFVVDTVVVRRIGIDEHRFRRVRYFRLPTGRWRRHEPWISTIGDLDTGRVLGVLDGRSNTGVGAWLAARTPASGDRIEVVATDPSAAFAKAIQHVPADRGDQRARLPPREARERHPDRGAATLSTPGQN